MRIMRSTTLICALFLLTLAAVFPVSFAFTYGLMAIKDICRGSSGTTDQCCSIKNSDSCDVMGCSLFCYLDTNDDSLLTEDEFKCTLPDRCKTSTTGYCARTELIKYAKEAMTLCVKEAELWYEGFMEDDQTFLGDTWKICVEMSPGQTQCTFKAFMNIFANYCKGFRVTSCDKLRCKIRSAITRHRPICAASLKPAEPLPADTGDRDMDFGPLEPAENTQFAVPLEWKDVLSAKIGAVLTHLSEDKVDKVAQVLIDTGVDQLSDLSFVQHLDIGAVLKPIEAKKLVEFLASSTQPDETFRAFGEPEPESESYHLAERRGGCTSKSCKNGGTCSHVHGHITCQCPPDYNGPKCEHRIEQSVSGACPKGFFSSCLNPNRCYRLIKSKESWVEGAETCRTAVPDGLAHLAIIDSAAETVNVQAVLSKHFDKESKACKQQAYMALTHLVDTSDSEWVWRTKMDATKWYCFNTATYFRFEKGQPDIVEHQNDNCAVLRIGTQSFQSVDCEKSLCSLCQYDLD